MCFLSVDCSKVVIFEMRNGYFLHHCTDPSPLEVLYSQTVINLLDYSTDLDGFTGWVVLNAAGQYRCYTGIWSDIAQSLVKDYPQTIQRVAE